MVYRKTDIKDAEWIADLLQHGLLRPSFIPPAWQRIVRELTRSRTSLSEERSRVVARLHKELEDATSKLASVASELMGKSAQQMLHALLAGDLTSETMAGFARGRMRSKQEQSVQALTGYLQAHHRFLLAEHLKPISDLQDAIARLSTEIAERLQPYEELLKRLETIPGVKRRLAEVILVEIGTDMWRFPGAQHCRWYVAVEADRVGSQGDQLLSQITGMDPKTIQRGRQELEHELAERPVDRVRLPGGGRPRAEKKMRSEIPPWRD